MILLRDPCHYGTASPDGASQDGAASAPDMFHLPPNLQRRVCLCHFALREYGASPLPRHGTRKAWFQQGPAMPKKPAARPNLAIAEGSDGNGAQQRTVRGAPKRSSAARPDADAGLQVADENIWPGRTRCPRSSGVASAPTARKRASGTDRKTGTAGSDAKIEERIAAASEELASGITEAASAAEELRRAMEQIASGAEEAACASQETLAVATNTATRLAQARERANSSRRRTEALQLLIGGNRQPDRRVGRQHQAERRAAGRLGRGHGQLAQQAASIGDVTKTVGQRLGPDQSSGAECRHRGRARGRSRPRFRRRRRRGARPRRNVREKRARRPRPGRANSGQVKSIAALIKRQPLTLRRPKRKRARPSSWRSASSARKSPRSPRAASRSQRAALEAEAAAREAQKGAEIISSAAEEQAAAAAEALRSVEQQSAALDESQSATQAWSHDGERDRRGERRRKRGTIGVGRRAAFRRGAGNLRSRRSQIMMRGRADQPRRPAAGRGDPAGERRDQSDREDGRDRDARTRSLHSIAPSRSSAMLAEVRSTVGDCRPA